MGQTTVYDYQNVLKITTLNRKMIYSGVSILMTTILSQTERYREAAFWASVREKKKRTTTSNFSELKYCRVLNCSNQNVFGQQNPIGDHIHMHESTSTHIHARASKNKLHHFMSFVFFPDARNFKAFLSYIKMVWCVLQTIRLSSFTQHPFAYISLQYARANGIMGN